MTEPTYVWGGCTVDGCRCSTGMPADGENCRCTHAMHEHKTRGIIMNGQYHSVAEAAVAVPEVPVAAGVARATAASDISAQEASKMERRAILQNRQKHAEQKRETEATKGGSNRTSTAQEVGAGGGIIKKEHLHRCFCCRLRWPLGGHGRGDS